MNIKPKDDIFLSFCQISIILDYGFIAFISFFKFDSLHCNLFVLLLVSLAYVVEINLFFSSLLLVADSFCNFPKSIFLLKFIIGFSFSDFPLLKPFSVLYLKKWFCQLSCLSMWDKCFQTSFCQATAVLKFTWLESTTVCFVGINMETHLDRKLLKRILIG